ncbi:hypothetical protein AAE478_008053 [Parahypoxylon ruwenzoriense]
MKYMKETTACGGIDKNIMFDRKVTSIEWSSKTLSWAVDMTANDERRETLRSRFIYLATGYFDYDEPLQTRIPGIDNFQGDVIHPQFWPDNFDYTNKSVVIIGSGATAITLLPAMADGAKHVTMLQRSPSYVLSVPMEGRFEKVVRAAFPAKTAVGLIRTKWIILPTLFRALCLRFPNAARKMLQQKTLSELKEGESLDPNFNPEYNPFEQRVCMCPDGDFYKCLRDGKGCIKTGVIEAVTSNSIKLKSGEELHPDVIVTATGLKLGLGGGMSISVDGIPFHLNDNFAWKGVMFEGLPNLAFSFGYFDASWTLAVDTSARLACRLLCRMKKDGVGAIIPRRSEEDKRKMKELQFIPLTSTYVEKARSDLPKVGDRGPWGPRAPFLWEQLTVKFGDISTGLDYIRDSA